MVELHTFLCSVSGGAREPEAAKQIVSPTCPRSCTSWMRQASTGQGWWTKLTSYDISTSCKKWGWGQNEGSLNWTESAMVSSTLKNSSGSRQQMDSWIPKTTCSQNVHHHIRKEKRRAQGRLEDLREISRIVDNKEMWDRFHSIVKKARGGSSPSKDQLRFGMTCVLVSLLYSSYQRPGAACKPRNQHTRRVNTGRPN